MIQSGHETQQQLPLDFYNRGLAYLLEDQYDRAIEDFNQAIRLNPNYAVAFVRRGAAYSAKDQYDRAIDDLDQAIRLNPNDAIAFNGRAMPTLARG